MYFRCFLCSRPVVGSALDILYAEKTRQTFNRGNTVTAMNNAEQSILKVSMKAVTYSIYERRTRQIQ
jgi:hypothetical protein